MGEIVVWAILLASVIVSSLIHYGIRKVERKRFADERRRLMERIKELELRLTLQRRPGTTSDMIVGFHGAFCRRSSVVELDFGSLVVVYQGDELDEIELDNWARQYISVAVVAQFCTTSELQGWLERRQ